MADEKIVKTDNQPEEKVQKSAKDGKDAKPAKKKGRGLGKRIAKYFRDLRGEFKKIIWPTFPTVLRNTGVTLAMCAFVGVLVCLFDLGLSSLVRLMLSL